MAMTREPMMPDAFRAILDVGDLKQREAARLLGVTERSIHRYARGLQPVPHTMAVVLFALYTGKITTAQIDEPYGTAWDGPPPVVHVHPGLWGLNTRGSRWGVVKRPRSTCSRVGGHCRQRAPHGLAGRRRSILEHPWASALTRPHT